MSLPVFKDLLAMLNEVLSPFGTFGVETDSKLNSKLPFITATILGGSDDRFTDTTAVDVAVFTADYSGFALSEQIRQALISGPIVTSLGVLDRVTTDNRPMELPWTDGSTIRRFQATYRVRARR